MALMLSPCLAPMVKSSFFAVTGTTAAQGIPMYLLPIGQNKIAIHTLFGIVFG